MEHQIYEKIAEEGSIVPVPLIMLAVAISFPFVVIGGLVEFCIRRIFKTKEETKWRK